MYHPKALAAVAEPIYIVKLIDEEVVLTTIISMMQVRPSGCDVYSVVDDVPIAFWHKREGVPDRLAIMLWPVNVFFAQRLC